MSGTAARPKVRIDQFPNGWCIRRVDGSIAAVQGFQMLSNEVSYRLAQLRANTLDLSALPRRHNSGASLSKTPKAQFGLRHRFCGKERPLAEQWAIYVSVQLPMCSLGTGSNRRYRWARVALGRLNELDAERISEAWSRVYAMWAWATNLKSTLTPAQLFEMDVPADVEHFLGLIAAPSAPSVQEIWELFGYDPETGRDIGARQRERMNAD